MAHEHQPLWLRVKFQGPLFSVLASRFLAVGVTCVFIMQAKAACDSFLPHSMLSPGDALLEAGESMKRLAEVKDSLDIEVKQNFIDPLQNLCDKDLKEIQVCPHPAPPGPDSQWEVLWGGPP